MNTLLALIKEPDESKQLVRFATSLAADLSSKLQLLYIQDPANYPFGAPGITGTASVQIQISMENLVKDAKTTLAKLVEEYDSGDVSVEITAETGIIKPTIEKLVSQKKINMVVLESSDSDGFWSQNSSDMDIVRNIKCPVWLIPHKSTYHPFSEILYATDYHQEDLPTLKKLIGLTHTFSPRITALHITDNMDFEVRIKKAGFREMVQIKTAYDQVTVKSLMERSGDDIGQLINDYASMIKGNLIVVLKENRPFLDRLFKSSVTKKIIQKAEIPVLVFHEQDA